MGKTYQTCMSCGKQYKGAYMSLVCTACVPSPSRRKPVYGGKTEPTSEQWVERHEVHSDDLERVYVVSKHREGHWACSCPVWKFRRQQCKHIARVVCQPA